MKDLLTYTFHCRFCLFSGSQPFVSITFLGITANIIKQVTQNSAKPTTIFNLSAEHLCLDTNMYPNDAVVVCTWNLSLERQREVDPYGLLPSSLLTYLVNA